MRKKLMSLTISIQLILVFFTLNASADDIYMNSLELRLPQEKYQSVELLTTKTPESTLWQKFYKDNGEWTINFDKLTLMPHRAFGKSIKIDGFEKINKENIQQAALSFLKEYESTFNISVNDLRFLRATKAGKVWYVSYRQFVKGIEVLTSEIELRIFENGKVMAFGIDFFNDISLEQTQIGNENGFSLEPKISYNVAKEKAMTGFSEKARANAVILSDERSGHTYILPVKTSNKITYHLVYDVKVRSMEPFGIFHTYIDAKSGEILRRVNLVNNATQFGVSGDVKMKSANDTLVNKPFSFQNIKINNNNYVTDIKGNIDVETSGVSTYLASFDGPYCKVDYDGRVRSSASGTFSANEPFAFNWNDNNSTLFERNLFFHANHIREKYKEIDPDCNVMDRLITIVLQMKSQMGTNAYSNLDSIVFTNVSDESMVLAGGPSVLYHEWGHSLNNLLYQSQGSPEGMVNPGCHEGTADATSCLLIDDSRIGPGVFKADTSLSIRNLLNQNKYPDDISGESHNDGQILGGAIWDLRLATTNELTTHLLQFARYGLPDDYDIGIAFSEWFIEFLVADDDDGDLSNGTPHLLEIISSFNNHQIGTNLIAALSFSHISLKDTENYKDPFTVNFDFDIKSAFPLKTDSVRLAYTTDDFATISYVSATEYGPGKYTADIPGQEASKFIKYFMVCYDPYSKSFIDLPLTGRKEPFSFLAGYKQVVYENFEDASNWKMGDVDDNFAGKGYSIAEPKEVNLGIFGAPEIILQPAGGHSEEGKKCIVTGPETSNGFNFINYFFISGKTTAFSPIYDFSSYSNAILSYYEWFNVLSLGEPNPDNPPTLSISYSANGGEWTTLYKGMPSGSGWLKKTISIPKEVNGAKEVQFRFVLENPSQQYEALVESLIDDFEILVPISNISSIKDNQLIALSTVQCFPNPFNEYSRIDYSMSQSTDVTLRILDIFGNTIYEKTLNNQTEGHNSIIWDGLDSNGVKVSSGMYFVEISTGAKRSFGKLVKM